MLTTRNSSSPLRYVSFKMRQSILEYGDGEFDKGIDLYYTLYIMNTAVINIRTDPETKSRAKEIAASLGFSLSSLIGAYLRQLIRTKTVFFSTITEEPTSYLLKSLKASEADRKAGRFHSFKSYDKAIDFLDKIVKQKDAD